MKTILISGGSDGLGKALANHFRQTKKYQVIILSNDEDKTRQVAKEIGCDFVIADVADYSQLSQAVFVVLKKYSTIDCLINNAGIWTEGPLDTNDPDRINRVIDVNTKGPIYLSRAVLPHMKEAKNGRIVNVISQAGLTAKAERSVYHASKWAITGLTKSLQMELVGTGVTVSGFYPGSMNTQFFAKAGIQKDPAKLMDIGEAVRAVDFIVETPDDLFVPELGIKTANY